MRFLFCLFFYFCSVVSAQISAEVKLGVDRLFEEEFVKEMKGKKIGLITNQTGVGHTLVSTLDQIKRCQKTHGYTLKALFAPEHGLYGEGHAEELIQSDVTQDGIPVHSLHGTTRRPTKKMLEGIDVLIYDIQ